MPLPTCSSCPYRHPQLNECRRVPPVNAQVRTVGTNHPTASNTSAAQWPIVDPIRDWCGEHPDRRFGEPLGTSS